MNLLIQKYSDLSNITKLGIAGGLITFACGLGTTNPITLAACGALAWLPDMTKWCFQRQANKLQPIDYKTLKNLSLDGGRAARGVFLLTNESGTEYRQQFLRSQKEIQGAFYIGVSGWETYQHILDIKAPSALLFDNSERVKKLHEETKLIPDR